MGADEFVSGERPDATGLSVLGLVERDDDELEMGGTGQLRDLPIVVTSPGGSVW
jgi:hypothetical protein